MSYKNLEIWKLSKEVAVEIHEMTLKDLPKFEMYEVGSQIRRSSKSTNANIVEGYGRRRYKADYLKFLFYSLSSNDETINHLEILFETKSLKDEEKFTTLSSKLKTLGIKINNFIQSVKRVHQTPDIYQ